MNSDIFFQILLHSEIKELPNLRLVNREFNHILNSTYYWKCRFQRDKLHIVKERDEFVNWLNEYQHVKRTAFYSSAEMMKAYPNHYYQIKATNIHNIEIFFVEGVDKVRFQRQFLSDLIYVNRDEYIVNFRPDGDIYYLEYLKGRFSRPPIYEVQLTLEAAQRILFLIHYYGNYRMDKIY